MNYFKLMILCSLFLFISCRDDDPVPGTSQNPIGDPTDNELVGFYLLNEGNMGTNKSTLDYYDFAAATYYQNIYADANPSVVKELGDVGNDIIVYGSKLYAVINCSNKIEVMDAKTAKRIGQIDIPNCRFAVSHNGFVYVTSYAGPVTIDPNYEQRGYVAKIDTSTLSIVATCLVGWQPDELAVSNNKLYVANSGGYMVPNYDTTVSVIDIASFDVIDTITVAQNLHRVCADSFGNV